MPSGNLFEVKTIDYTERLPLSRAGNPRFKVHFTDGTSAITNPDSSVNYVIDNPSNQGVPLRVEFTPNGRIVGITRANFGE